MPFICATVQYHKCHSLHRCPFWQLSNSSPSYIRWWFGPNPARTRLLSSRYRQRRSDSVPEGTASRRSHRRAPCIGTAIRGRMRWRPAEIAHKISTGLYELVVKWQHFGFVCGRSMVRDPKSGFMALKVILRIRVILMTARFVWTVHCFPFWFHPIWDEKLERWPKPQVNACAKFSIQGLQPTLVVGTVPSICNVSANFSTRTLYKIVKNIYTLN